MRQTRHKSNRLIVGVGGTSFPNVLVILAAIFLLGAMTVPHSHHGSGPDLPRVDHAVSMSHANREDAIVIAVTRDGKFYFQTDLVQPEQLPSRIQVSIAGGAEAKVYIKADALARYIWVSQVLDSVRAAGIPQIGVLVDQRHGGNVVYRRPQ